MIVRPGTESDVGPVVRIWLANHLYDEDRGEYVSTYARHLVKQGRLQIAEIDGHVVGFGASVVAGAVECLSDLFVDPAFQARGIGSALVAQIWPGQAQRVTFSSNHPAAMPLYVKVGLSPWWPLLYVHGGASKLPRVHGLTIAAASQRRAIDWELQLTGVDRTQDYEFWTSPAIGGEPFLAMGDRGPVGVGISADNPDRRGRKLVRLLIERSADHATIVMAALSWITRDGPTRLAIPGPNPATRLLLASGFVIDAMDIYMATRRDLVDPVWYLPDPALM